MSSRSTFEATETTN